MSIFTKSIHQDQKERVKKEKAWANERMRVKSFAELHSFDKSIASAWAAAYPIMSAVTVVACMFFVAFDWELFITGQYETGMYVLSGLSLMFFAAGAITNERVKATSLSRFFSLRQHKKRMPTIHISGTLVVKATISCLLSIFLSTWGYVSISKYSVDKSIEIKQGYNAAKQEGRESLSAALARVDKTYDDLVAGQRDLLATSFSNARRFKTRRKQINDKIAALEAERLTAKDAERKAYESRRDEVTEDFGQGMADNEIRTEMWALVAAISTLIGEILYVVAVSFLALYAAKLTEEEAPASTGDKNQDTITQAIHAYKIQSGLTPTKNELFHMLKEQGMIGKASDGKIPKSTFYRLVKSELRD